MPESSATDASIVEISDVYGYHDREPNVRISSRKGGRVVVLLHYRVVPGLGATPPPTPTSPRAEQVAVPVSNAIAADPGAASASKAKADVDEPCDCPGVAISISVAA